MSINWALIIALVGVVGSVALLVAIERTGARNRRAQQRYAAEVQRFRESLALDQGEEEQ